MVRALLSAATDMELLLVFDYFCRSESHRYGVSLFALHKIIKL